MAKIEDLISQVGDEKLRKALSREVRDLKKKKSFGLVFEEHLPETARIPTLAVREGEQVAFKREKTNSSTWKVQRIVGSKVILERPGATDAEAPDNREAKLDELVVVRTFGDPIYPALSPVDRVAEGGSERPWHVLINADNFHALQLLLYSYENQVDFIYLDPPYNSGARDWKYNNDYVDSKDTFRHSKWLSMMKKRLLLAKRLLKDDGVMVVTIDENEVHHLWCLLEDLFPGEALQQTTIVINPKGVTQERFSRVEEFAIYLFRPGATPSGKADDYLTPEPDDGFQGAGSSPRWKGLLRSGTNARREDRENMFYPILIDEKLHKIVGTGEALLEGDPDPEARINGYRAAWPIRTNKQWGNWGVGYTTLRRLIDLGYVSLGEYDKSRKTWAVSYLSQLLQEQIEGGLLDIVARDPVTNVVDVRYTETADRRIKTVWKRSRHDAGAYGSSLLTELLGRTEAFSFPKSLYAVEDTILPFVRHKRSALILDFFAGSGTTFHATCLMNWRDGGTRRSISVTNNEVSPEQAEALQKQGLFPGDASYEQAGVANSVTWPRMKAALVGKAREGKALSGSYLGTNIADESRAFAEGFEENAEFFRLDFLDPNDVARGDAFKAILPVLWLTAGAMGEREDSKGSARWFIPKNSPFAVLMQEKHFGDFRAELSSRADIKWLFLVTDSDENFVLMRRRMGRGYNCTQLYKNYLDNFRLNALDA